VTLPADLAAGGVLTCTATGTATLGQYTNTGTVTGTPKVVVTPPELPGFPTSPSGTPVTSTDTSHYYGYVTTVDVTKYTNGYDADTLADPRPVVVLNSPITWTYRITNTGNVTLTGLSLFDDKQGTVSCPTTSLAPGASTVCTLTGTASTLGIYTNTGTITGTPQLPTVITPELPGFPTSPPVTSVVTDTNTSHYETYQVYQLGNYVWVDTNGNGVQDESGTGLNGVVVTLLDGSGNVLSTTTTTNGGYYTFTNLFGWQLCGELHSAIGLHLHGAKSVCDLKRKQRCGVEWGDGHDQPDGHRLHD